MEFRIEKDTMGEVKVPANRYWGAQTERSRNNFKIGPEGSMPKEVIHAFALLKKAAAHTNFDLGVLPEEKMKLISRVCDEILNHELDDEFPLVIWQTGSGTQSNMNVNEVIANRAHVVAGGKLEDEKKVLHPNDDVNKSQSSNDTFPTAIHIAAYQVLVTKTIPALQRLQKEFALKSDSFDKIIKTGRTHLMDATPLSLGQEFSAFATQLKHAEIALSHSSQSFLSIALGGTAVGTGLNAPNGYAEIVAKKIAAYSGFPFVSAENKFEALASHDAFAEVSGSLKRCAVALLKIVNDLRMMASGPRCGLGEISIPDNEPGSSIMPGKVNPTQIEAMTMVCAQVMGNDTTIAVAASNGQFQLNVYKPVIVSNLLESANLLADACESLLVHCVQGIEPNQEKIKHYLENSLMLVTALNPKIGYDKAAQIAKYAYKENCTLKKAALDLGFLNEEEFDTWVDPKKMI